MLLIMLKFSILHQSTASQARLGLLETSYGIVETPAFVPVATQAVVKTLATSAVLKTGSQFLIANTFHLHLKPGEAVVAQAGGLHHFMAWPKPLMTDSGGFQVFSLGFGRDLQIGKVLKIFPAKTAVEKTGAISLAKTAQPRTVKITDDGVYFTSPLDGRQLFIGPKESILIQQQLGADIIFAFDECTAALASRDYIEGSLQRTHRWAKICLETKQSDQALFGIVQGSHFERLRQASASFMNNLPFAGFGIGGDLGQTKKDMEDILKWTIPHLQPDKPRHLLGIGYLEDMAPIIRHGIDLFDCTVPTHFARRGIAFTSLGKINLHHARHLTEALPLDRNCSCDVCTTYQRSYLGHLIRAKEITGWQLLTQHNLFYFNAYVASLRQQIKDNQL